jgi:hypothetical protein
LEHNPVPQIVIAIKAAFTLNTAQPAHDVATMEATVKPAPANRPDFT